MGEAWLSVALWELATHAGQIMDRDALLKNLRGVSYDGMDRSVDVAISRLRKKLQDNARCPAVSYAVAK